MAGSVTIVGTEIVVKNLRRSRDVVVTAANQGLLLAGLELQRQSQDIVPVEFGVLKASAFTRQSQKNEVSVGYTALYALYVHEQIGMVLQGQDRRPSPPHIGKYWDPQGRGQAKFLEAPFRNFKPTLMKIVAERVRGALS